jgi:DNA-directed RNA polymerase subunit H (RpoH/RPB5)
MFYYYKKMSGSYSPLLSKIYISRNIILDIMKQRNYNTEDYEGFSMTEVISMYNNKQLDMLLKKNDSNSKILIKYHIDNRGLMSRLNDKHIYDYLEDYYEDDDEDDMLNDEDEMIIVSKDKMPPPLESLLQKLFIDESKFINVYNINDYLVNILNHDMVPNHRILGDEEKNEVKKRYNIKNDKEFPEINRFGPIAKTIGLKPGELCEITRSSPTSVTSLYYRLCY